MRYKRSIFSSPVRKRQKERRVKNVGNATSTEQERNKKLALYNVLYNIYLVRHKVPTFLSGVIKCQNIRRNSMSKEEINISQLNVGMVVKNYRQMCELLEQPVYNGKSKNEYL